MFRHRPTLPSSAHQLIRREFGEYVLDGGDINVYCPLCRDPHRHDAQHYHLGIEPQQGIWHCFRCRRSGRLSALFEKLGHSEAEAIALARELRNSRGSRRQLSPPRTEQALPAEVRPISTGMSVPYVRKFLNARRLTEEDWRRYQMGWCTSGRYAGRLILPVVHNGSIKTFVGRDMRDMSDRKYLHPRGATLSHYLFGLNMCVRGGDVVLMEGPLDAVRYGPSAVASFGKFISDRQIFLLGELEPAILFVCLDGDAWSETQETAARLEFLFEDVRVVRLPKKHDPGSLPARILRHHVLRRSRPLKERERWHAQKTLKAKRL